MNGWLERRYKEGNRAEDTINIRLNRFYFGNALMVVR